MGKKYKSSLVAFLTSDMQKKSMSQNMDSPMGMLQFLNQNRYMIN